MVVGAAISRPWGNECVLAGYYTQNNLYVEQTYGCDIALYQ